MSSDWNTDSMHWWGEVLSGRFAHWCNDWDGLPIDETCDEFGCCACAWDPPSEQAAKDEASETAYLRNCGRWPAPATATARES